MLYEKIYKDEKIFIEASMDFSYHMNFRFTGRGSSKSVVVFIDMLTKMHEKIPVGETADSVLDCLEYGRTPLLSQIRIGKWLLQNQQKTGRISIVGAKPLEVKIAKAIMRMTSINRIGFFATNQAAHDWLGWKPATAD